MKGLERKIGVLCARELQVSIADSVHRLLEQIIQANKYFTAFYDVKQKEIIGRNGTFFAFKGLKHNISEIKSYEGVDYCWVEEAECVSDKSWETLIPTIRKPDSEIIISFNPKNPTDPTYRRFVLTQDDDVIARKVSWRDNPFFPGVLEKERVKLLKNDPEAYEHIWEGKFDTRYSGAVYAKHVRQEQIKDDVTYDPTRPIFTAWDLGYDDATAIVFYQLAKNEIHVIDYFEDNFEDVQHYCEALYGARIKVDKREARTGKVLEWHFNETLEGSEHRCDYNYNGGTHYVPHDAANKLQAAGGRSIVEQAQEFGVVLFVIPAASQQDSEQALRKALPRCWFNQTRTADLVHALMSYHYEYDEDRKIYGKLPVHDWSSHACFIGTTEVLTRYATYQIMNLPQTGEVLTPCGWKPYHSPRITRKNAQLVEVVFSDGLMVKCTPEHLFLTEDGWKSAESLKQGTVIQSSLTNLRNTLMEDYTACGRVKYIWRKEAKDYIVMFGSALLEKFQRAVTSIIKIKMCLITALKIWNVCLHQSIYQNHGTTTEKSVQRVGGFLKQHETERRHGTGLKKGDYGTAVMPSGLSFGQFISENLKRAQSVVKNIWQQPSNVQTPQNFALQNADKLTIESVRPIYYKSDVWCITVPDAACFSLSNGAVVHNCDSVELMARAWQDAGMSMEQIRLNQMDAKFHRLRRENKVDGGADPYRMKPVRVGR